MTVLLFLGGIGAQEILIVFGIVLLLFGGRKIPELMRGIGKGIREFNTARSSLKNEIEEGMKEGEENQKKSPASATDQKAAE